MNQRMEILSPSSYIRNANWLFEESKGGKWTPEENKQFESALALFDKDTPDRWHNVAAMIPGKTVSDVIKQYRELEEDVRDIEAGLIPIPGYNNSSFTLEWVNNQDPDDLKQYYSPGGKQNSSTRPSDHERKKGVPWTEEEHRQFLMGLKKYGKGDWRNISRNFVTSRTPTQVASHAQKYFIRQLSGGKDKRRSSIHDITTSDITGTKSPSPDPDSKRPRSPDQSSMVKQPQQHTNMNAMAAELYNWNQTNQGVNMAFNLPNNNLFMATSCGTSSYGLELQAQSLQNHALHGHAGTHNIIFEMQSMQRR